mgnify:CR=1 FL=1
MTAENRRFLLPPIINRILTLLTEQGFAAYVVGGAVRDLLLGKIPGDFDVATSARPESVISILEPAGFTVVGELGQNFGVVVVHRDAQTVEIATFRGEAYGGDAHKPEQVWYCDDLEADLSRRDFTVNAMALDQSGNVYDYHGGRQDLQQKILRTVGDAPARYQEDALRMYRACRFVGQLGFDYVQRHGAGPAFGQPQTPYYLPQSYSFPVSRSAGLSLERVRTELDKLLVKRVIGLPGDTVSFSGGYVYINGQRLEEKYLDQQGGTISPDQSSFTVPEGCLFFLGDNRSGSNDARYWEESYIPVGNVKARVLLAISLTGGSSWQGVRAIG